MTRRQLRKLSTKQLMRLADRMIDRLRAANERARAALKGGAR